MNKNINKMEKNDGVVKVSLKERGRKRNMKRNAITVEILQQFSECPTEANFKTNNSKKPKNKSTQHVLKLFKREVEPEVQTFQTQALEIAQPGPEFDPNATPQDGMQFLMKMYYERERCPVIVQCPLPDSTESSSIVQTTDPDAMQTSFDTTKEFDDKVVQNIFLTTPEWINAQTCTFLKARSKVTLLRINKSMESLPENTELPTKATEEADWLAFCETHEPNLSLILQFGQRQLELLLEYLSKWLQESSGATETADEVETSTPESTCDLLGNKRWLGLWIYATLVCLELPLEPQVHSTLREIARSCILLRSRLECDAEQMAQQYNVFVAIIVCVFEQYDFKEFL